MNAVKTQIWVAVSVYVLMAIAQKQNDLGQVGGEVRIGYRAVEHVFPRSTNFKDGWQAHALLFERGRVIFKRLPKARMRMTVYQLLSRFV